MYCRGVIVFAAFSFQYFNLFILQEHYKRLCVRTLQAPLLLTQASGNFSSASSAMLEAYQATIPAATVVALMV